MDETGKIQVKKPSGFIFIGKNYCFMYHGEIIITIGPDWPLNICVLSFIISMLIFFLFVMAPEMNPLFQLIGFIIYFGLFISYLLTALKDPGIILSPWEIDLEQGKSPEKLCKICNVAYEKNSSHCDECNICIRGHDHHCVFSGKCIGAGNIIPFYLFLTSISLSILYFALWIFFTFRITSHHS